jgi:hypothetical protein
MGNHHYLSILYLGEIPSVGCTIFFSIVSSHTRT